MVVCVERPTRAEATNARVEARIAARWCGVSPDGNTRVLKKLCGDGGACRARSSGTRRECVCW
jgi:hypothetical protein